MNETRDLFTATDLKKYREELIALQKGLCACTGDPLVKPCLDHAHDSQQLCRGVLSHGINIYLGTLESAYIRRVKWWSDIPLSELLRKIADYLEKEPLPVRHTGWLKKVQTEFNKLSESEKGKFLSFFELPDGKNSKERKVLFQNILKTKDYSFEDITTRLQEARSK